MTKREQVPQQLASRLQNVLRYQVPYRLMQRINVTISNMRFRYLDYVLHHKLKKTLLDLT